MRVHTQPTDPRGRTRLVSSVLAASVVALGMAGAASAEPVGAAVPTSLTGTATGWGYDGQEQTQIPASLAGRPIAAVAAGAQHALALTADGDVVGWGNDFGGATTAPPSLSGEKVTAIAAGSQFSLALTADGDVVEWGHNTMGVPAELDGTVVTAIAASDFHALALTAQGKVVAWGMSLDGPLDPPPGLDGETVTAIATGREASAAVTADGDVVVWGEQSRAAVPASVADEDVTQVAVGGQHVLALTSGGKVEAWGSDGNGQTDVPASLDDEVVTAIAAGAYHSLALTADGDVVGWGVSGGGDDVPARLAGHRATAIAGGQFFSLAVTATLSTTGTPSVDGTARVGQTLTAVAPTYNAVPDARGYTWFADGQAIGGATASTLALTPALQGATITVQVAATKAGYDPSTTVSAASAAVAPAPVAPAPVAPVPAPSAPRAPTATQAGKVYARSATGGVVLTGSGVRGASVTVREGGVRVGTAVVGADGRWTLSTAPLSMGRHTFTSVQSIGGRTSAVSAPIRLTLERLGVRVSKLVSPTRSVRPLVRGKGNAGATVVVRTTAGRTLGRTVVAANGSWRLRTTRLARGTYKVRAVQTVAGTTTRSTVTRFRVKRR